MALPKAVFWRHREDGHPPILLSITNSDVTAVPFVPETYTLRAEVTRVQGTDTFGFGLVLGKHRTVLSMDAFGGKVTGLHLLDGKPALNNASSVKGAILPQGQKVRLECRVARNRIVLTADGRTVLDWTGDPSRLALNPNFDTPNKQWLFLTCHSAMFDIAKLTLAVDK